MKRKFGSGPIQRASSSSFADGPQGSRFVLCPACQKRIAAATINMHLDMQCSVLAAGPLASHTPDVLQHQKRQQAPQPQHQGVQQQPQQQLHQQGVRQPQQEKGVRQPQQEQGVRQPQQELQQQLVQQAEQQKPAEARPSGGSAAATRAAPLFSWRPLPALAFARSGSTRGLTAEALFAVSACELVSGFLPPKLAAEILDQLMAHQADWQQMQLRPSTGPGTSIRTACHYSLQDDAAGSPGSVGSDYGLVSMQGFPALERAAELVALAVNARLQRSGGAAMLPLEAADRQSWRPNCAVANCYASGAVSMAAHSDRMTALGPCPIIASLSLGATRCFRLHRTQRVKLLEGAGGTDSGSVHDAAVAAGAGVVRVDLQLAHNQLLVMWPPTQETWKHEVTRTSKPFPLHKQSGPTRFNLTFRRMKPEWQRRVPTCRCGRPAVMKAHVPKQPIQQQQPTRELRYYYACESDGRTNPSCGFYVDVPHVATFG